MKADTPGLIKFKHLKHLLGRPEFVVVGVLEGLWIATAKNAFMGDIGRFTDQQIASILEWDGDAKELIQALCEAEWIDAIDSDARLVIHDWYDNAAQYVVQKIHRKLGITAEQLKAYGGKEAARHSWEKHIGIPMCESQICDAVHMQNGTQQADTSSHARANLSHPIPSQPNPSSPIPSQPADDVSAEWAAAAAAVVGAGLGIGLEAVEDCRQRGCEPVDVRRVLSFWRDKQPAWGPGALAYRLGNLLHNQDPGAADLWPPVAKAAAVADNSADRERVAAEAAAKREEGELRRLAAKAESARLEDAHGATVDALTQEQVCELAKQLKQPVKAPPAGKDTKGFLRDALLSHLDLPR